MAKDMKEQDNRITANPRYYAIQDDEDICGLNPDYTDDYKWLSYDNDILCTLEEALKHYDESKEIPSDRYGQEDFLRDEGWDKVGVITRQKYGNVFFTEKAIKRHIEANHYHYENPSDFLFHAFRNPEMEGVINAIMEIGEAEVEE